MISWKKGCDFLPEFDIDYRGSNTIIIKESKPYKDKGVAGNADYYPGFTLKYNTVRNPYSKMKKSFFPTIALGIFIICIYQIKIDLIHERLQDIAICMLSFVSLLSQIRAELPEVQETTIGEQFIILYIVSSCLPLVHLFGKFVESADE